MAPDSLQVKPGETTSAVITVHNASQVVDLFLIEVNGLDPSWFELSVSTSSLMPRDESSSTLTITVPKTSDSLANDYPFTVRVSSQKDSTQETVISGNLKVHPYYCFTLDLHPQRASGARGHYKLSIASGSNAELAFNLSGRDPEDLCQFYFHQHPRVPNGQTTEIDLMVEPGQRPLLGRPKLYGFTLTASPDPSTVDLKTIRGSLEVTPRFALFRPRPVVPNPSRPVPTPRPSRSFPWRAFALIASLLVVAVVLAVVLWQVIDPGGPEAPFLLKPAEDVSFLVPEDFMNNGRLPLKIRASVEWKGKTAALALTMRPPGEADHANSLEVSPSSPWADFEISEDQITSLGVRSWILNLKNISDIDQAEGIVKIQLCDSC